MQMLLRPGMVLMYEGVRYVVVKEIPAGSWEAPSWSVKDHTRYFLDNVGSTCGFGATFGVGCVYERGCACDMQWQQTLNERDGPDNGGDH